MILLDTHALIWLVEGHSHLGKRARRLTDEALAREELSVSAISFWETAMLHQRNRIRLAQPLDAWRQAILTLGVNEVAVTGDLGITAVQLPDFHPDPADRMIIATAIFHRATLITADEQILNWSGSVRRHDAQR